MELKSEKLTKEQAMEILSWKYDPPYDLYNNEMNNDSINELLEENYMGVFDQAGKLIGFYCSGISAQVPAGRQKGAYNEDAVDVGIGMKPDLTGKGNGLKFFSFVLKELQNSLTDTKFRLTVAAFNKRAITLYENVGFEKDFEFANGLYTFITMLK